MYRPHSRYHDVILLAEEEPLRQAHSQTATALGVKLSPAGDVSRPLLRHADELIPACCCAAQVPWH